MPKLSGARSRERRLRSGTGRFFECLLRELSGPGGVTLGAPWRQDRSYCDALLKSDSGICSADVRTGGPAGLASSGCAASILAPFKGLFAP